MGLQFLLVGAIDRVSVALAIAGTILLLGAVLSLRRL
jgi:hypothetical protein